MTQVNSSDFESVTPLSRVDSSHSAERTWLGSDSASSAWSWVSSNTMMNLICYDDDDESDLYTYTMW